MELKLGELLIKEKLITAEQLEEALTSQTVYGVRLGSSLIEMGYVEEDALARVLSEKLGVPYVGSEQLSDIPKEVIRDFSRAMVIKYRVVPFKLERNRLGLAMTDPNDFRAIEEIAFITGHVVQPYIAPDVHISHAQAKYYRISGNEALYQQAAELRHSVSAAHIGESATISIPAVSENGELLNVIIPAEFEDFASLNEVLDDELPRNPMIFQNMEKREIYTVERLSHDFAGARSRDEVADVFIRYLGQEFNTGALFILRGTVAVGWRGVGKGTTVKGLADLSLLLSKPSVLRDVVETRTFSLGSLINTPENRLILDALELSSDASLFVVPVLMLNKVVVVVLVSAEMDDLSSRLSELQNLVRKVSLAFEMLIIKKKILMT
jgi:hypothetical protein